jgi:hypothetical protein
MSPPIIIDLIYSSIFLLDSKAKERKTDADVQRETERVREEKKRNTSILKSLLSYAVREYE